MQQQELDLQKQCFAMEQQKVNDDRDKRKQLMYLLKEQLSKTKLCAQSV